jgi:hypothetical protein
MKQLVIGVVCAAVHAVAVARVPEKLVVELQPEQVPLPSGRHVAHPVIEAGEALVLLQRTQPDPVTK